MQPLLDNQRNAFERLKTLKVGALFMEPGTGKTRTAYELMRSVPECDYLLWLTPFLTKDNLREELAKWGAKDIRIEGIESLSNSDRLYLELWSELEAAKQPFIVVDESLKIKNWTAKRTNRIVELGRLAEYKLILNGTPLSRNLLDIWAQMEFLSPKILNMPISEYKNTFCEYTRITKRIGNNTHSREWISKHHNVDYLYSLITHYVYECDLHLELERQYIELPYKIECETREEYARLKETYLDDETLQWKNNNIFLEMTQKMQHTYACAEDKFIVLDAWLKTVDHTKVIVYAKYISSQVEIAKRYPKIKVLSYGKHSYGLNLQEYNIILFWDKTWDYAQRLQTERRIDRTGQQSQTLYFYTMTGDVGLERMIDRNINKKHDLLTYLKSLSIEQLRQEL
jgi:hypothetical protein